MASKSLGTLTLDLVAKTSSFVAGMGKAERATTKWRKKAVSDAKKVGTAIGKGLATASIAGAAALAFVVNSTRQTIDEQAKLAKQVNTTYTSLANLKRAGELAGVGFKQITVAGRQLDVVLGKAAEGEKIYADVVDKLGISIEELIRLPLDERLKKVNIALLENVSAAERASVAADLFGTRNGAAIRQLQPDVIAQAAKEVAIFGLNLSEVDAAKVELANDAISTLGLGLEGLKQQLTVAVAPAIQGVGLAFLDYAEDAGGANVVVADSFDGVVKAAAKVADVADGIGRAFVLAADSAIIAFSVNEQLAASARLALLKVGDIIPGGFLAERIAKEEARIKELEGVIFEASENIRKNLEDPLAGNAILKGYEDAKKAAQESAEAAAQAKKDLIETGDPDPADDTTDKALTSTEKLIFKLQEQANTLGKTARQITLYKLETEGATEAQIAQAKALLSTIDIYNEGEEVLKDFQEQQKKTSDDYKALVGTLRTEEEKLNDELRERLKLIEKVNDATEESKSQSRQRAVAGAFADAPETEGLAPEVGGALGEIQRLNDDQEELDKWYSDALDRLAQFRQERSDLNAEWDEQELALKQQHEDALADIEQARQLASYTAAEELFGSLSGLAKQFAGEQSDAYKILFAAEKAAAIARSIVAIQTAIAQASASAPFPANLAAMASVAAATAGLISTITSTTISGQAHDGLMSVPTTGTYILEKGERVTTAETSAKLDKTLSDVQGGGAGGKNIRIVNSFDAGEVVGGFMGSDSGEELIMNVVRRNSRTIKSLAV